MFAAAPDLTPRDVIVMVPRVADYAPFIHSVFKGRLPYSITDRSMTCDAVTIFLALTSGLVELPT